MPTGFGVAFGGVAVLLLILAIGYMNNLLYVFVFMLISMALTSMWTTNKNIEKAELENIAAPVLFANEKNLLTVVVKNKNLRASLWDLQIKAHQTADIPEQIYPQIKPFSIETLRISWIPKTRGSVNLPRLHIHSHFPFRLLRAWKYFDKQATVIVYPERKGSTQLPFQSGQSAEQEKNALTNKVGFFKDYRDFQSTDSPSRIAWKKSLKIQKHLVKNYESSGEQKVLIDWTTTDQLSDPEQRISQLATWIDVCHNSNANYSLKIKNFQTGYGHGVPHYKQCMQKLALLTAAEYE